MLISKRTISGAVTACVCADATQAIHSTRFFEIVKKTGTKNIHDDVAQKQCHFHNKDTSKKRKYI